MKAVLTILALAFTLSGCSSLGLSGINSAWDQLACRFALDSSRVKYAQDFKNMYELLDPTTDALIIKRYAPYLEPVMSSPELCAAYEELAQYLDTKYRVNGTFR